jgi:subtilisin family serine protease
VNYAIAAGLRFTSNSWGGGGFSQALLDAINAAGAAGQLFIAAAGNDALNTDVSPHYPSSYNTPYIIAVAATDHNDNLASFSNYSATLCDLAAPGVDILSTVPGGYDVYSGTSMATPHVAGAVALTWGRYPALQNLQVKDLILNSVDVKPQLQGKMLTNCRLNAFMAIAEPDSIPPGAISNLMTVGRARTAWARLDGER